MEIIGSLILFLVFIFVYSVIVEIFVMLFRITGLTDEKARFQVISMLTNSGYTTREAELVVNSPKRRKLAGFVMIFGYAFTVTIVSTVVNIFLQFRHTATGGAVAFIPMIIAVITMRLLVKKTRIISSLIDKIIKETASRFVYNENFNQIIIMDDYGDLVIAKIELVIMPEELKNIKLSKSNIRREHGINVLLKSTSEGRFIPQGDTTFELRDTVLVMGSKKSIKRVFDLKEDKYLT
ncbi:MAG: hypothetical protein CSB55_06010 [Candidatus Cloacimonadota bacterium]|nr:MAG: hypothetical protein CSB55_06010 [Candidatus Cloacimonadota bacterium]